MAKDIKTWFAYLKNIYSPFLSDPPPSETCCKLHAVLLGIVYSRESFQEPRFSVLKKTTCTVLPCKTTNGN